jgi:LEA14-like dessication related protein
VNKLAMRLLKFLFLILSTTLLSCSSLTKNFLKDPEVKVLDLAITNISAQDISIDVKLNINNPNPVPINISKITYGLNFSGKNVTEGVFDQGIQVPSQGAGEVTVPLKFKYSAINSLIDGFMKKSLSKDYELTGAVDMGIFSIPFNKKGQIDLKK